MARYCFVHAADLHLDTPFEGVRRAAPEVQAALVDASLEAWDALVELTLERDALFLLLAGDLYDGARRGLRAQLRLLRGIERLCAAGVRVFAVQGNHDPVGEGWSAVRRWPEGFTLFGSEAVANVPLERGGSRLATVYGISYAERATRENLALRFRRGSEEGLHVGLLHCNVGGASGHEPYSPCSVEDLARSRLDYWALGHIHTQRILREGDPWIVYPGSLQGRSPKPGELGAKGAVVVEVEGQRVTGVEPVFVDRVRFLAPEVDAARCSDLADLERALGSAAEAARAENEGRALVLRARLVGRSALGADLRRPGALAELLAALRDRSEGLSPWLWWESLQSELRAELDREALRARDDFSSELLAASDALALDDEARASFLDRVLRDLPPRERGVDLPALAQADGAALLAEGERSALELLADATPERE
ncbi:MAG: DNA repair exonuclease [Deltaproteobacteria bacterium]|nr:DNA repair exonuclease [Deltaproteobacteria bacterium]MBW2418442.1 DNA repair exonuclease [Deltaproteobacteria bacterium]